MREARGGRQEGLEYRALAAIYNGFQALFGNKYVAPAMNHGLGYVSDLDALPIADSFGRAAPTVDYLVPDRDAQPARLPAGLA
jgi:hypothetical protein